MNKRGFDCALLFAHSLLPYLLYFPSFSPHITQASCIFFLFYLVPHQVSNHLPFTYIFLASLSSTPLHHEIQLRFMPQKLIVILLDSLACPKINITIYSMLYACCTLHKNMHRICGSLENKMWTR